MSRRNRDRQTGANKMNLDITKTLMILISVLTVLIVIINFTNNAACIKKWSDSNYSWLSGCKVNVNGVYIPEDNVRIIKWEYTE